MKRVMIILAVGLLVGCEEPEPCMISTELGTVTGLGTEDYQEPYNCGRAGCAYRDAVRPTVKYRMRNGASRICLIDTNANALLRPGDVVQGAKGERRL